MIKMSRIYDTLCTLCAFTLLVAGTQTSAATRVTVGVGHMCCGNCKSSAKSALTKVASDVAIEGSDVTITLKEGETNIAPVLAALSKAGFPATRIDAGSGSVTLGVGHLCCGKCKSGLQAALKNAKVEELDLDSITVGDNNVTFKAKAGMKLNLASVIAAMEKGGFSATTITMGAS